MCECIYVRLFANVLCEIISGELASPLERRFFRSYSFNGLSTFVCYEMQTHSFRRIVGVIFKRNVVDKGIHNFPKGISTNVNPVKGYQVEFAIYDVTVQNVTHFITENHNPWNIVLISLM